MGYMKDAEGTLQHALYLQAALGVTAAILYLCLGQFGRKEFVRMKRYAAEKVLEPVVEDSDHGERGMTEVVA
jgi:hypothetical protein